MFRFKDTKVIDNIRVKSNNSLFTDPSGFKKNVLINSMVDWYF